MGWDGMGWDGLGGSGWFGGMGGARAAASSPRARVTAHCRRRALGRALCAPHPCTCARRWEAFQQEAFVRLGPRRFDELKRTMSELDEGAIKVRTI